MNVDEAMAIADSSNFAAEWYDGRLIEAVGVLRKEVERLRGELSAEGTAGELILQDYRDLRIENKRLVAELAKAKAASVVPVITLDCYTVNHEIHVACRSLQDCHKLSLWLRDRIKERGEG
jgi:hypothetical protein